MHTGTVYLRVQNLDPLITFYQERIGLRLLGQDAERAHLGTDDESPLLTLHHSPQTTTYRGVTGLYHFALLVPTRRDLALVLRHLAETGTKLQGVSDHLVSEAIYLADPEGNGIEIYADRPRSAWQMDGDRVQMAVLPLDVDDLMRELDSSPALWQGLPPGTTMGHVHLHVDSVEQAAAFYREVLHMDTMFEMPSAAFLSYEGYHHHVGINTWGVRGPAPADAAGLQTYDLHITDADLRNRIAASLESSGHDFQVTETGWMVNDPAGNTIRIHHKVS